MTYRILRCLDKADWLERRKAVVTSTEVSALPGFDCNPYLTPAQLWAQKYTQIFPERRMTPEMQEGLDQEAHIARKVAKKMGWEAKPFPNWMFAEKTFCGLDGSPTHVHEQACYLLGSSFDWAVRDRDGICPDEVKKLHIGAMGKYWRCDGDRLTQTSDHVKLQIQTQMMVCEFDRIKVSAKFGGRPGDIESGWYLGGEFRADPFLWRRIKDQVEAFFDSIRRHKPPEGATRTRVWRLYLEIGRAHV